MAMNWWRRLWTHGPGGDAATPAAAAAPTTTPLDMAGLAPAIADYRARRFEAAGAKLQALLAEHPTDARPHYFLGLCELGLGHDEAAADALVLATHFDPTFAEAHIALATAEQRLGRHAQALASLDRAAELQGPTARGARLRGVVLAGMGRIDDAIAAFEHCVALDPDDALGHSNLGYLRFVHRAEYDLGAMHLERALQLAPADATVQSNHTLLLLAHRQDLDATIAACDRLLQAHPEMHEVRLNRGIAKLKSGRFDDGWDDYEARKSVDGHFLPRGLDLPAWDGADAPGKTVLIHAEQGLGDEIMFASCFEDAIARAGRCIIECSPRLHALFARSFPRAEVVAGRLDGDGIRARGVDLQCAAGSLPRFFRRAWEQFPDHRGYLRPDPDAVAAWHRRLDALGPGRKIGLSWQGGVVTTRRSLRSVPLERFARLLGRDDCTFVDLQYGDTVAERAAFETMRPGRLVHWPEAIADLDAGAALITALDRVVTVCTTAAHMTGALGRPAWILVPANAEWRYLTAGERMPWYPSARVFRQDDPSEWDTVLERIAVALDPTP